MQICNEIFDLLDAFVRPVDKDLMAFTVDPDEFRSLDLSIDKHGIPAKVRSVPGDDTLSERQYYFPVPISKLGHGHLSTFLSHPGA